jgi:DnaK suppressor protein
MGKKVGMSKKKLEEFRGVLNSWKDTLVKEALQSIEGMTEVQELHADLTDQASAEADRDFLLRIKDRERKLILKIREALTRIDDGTYGTCEVCGEQISEERLKARPVTTQCIECKTDMEDQERRAAG